MEGIGREEGKYVFYQLHVNALLEVTLLEVTVGVPRHLRHQQLPLQGTLKQKVAKAGKSRGKGEGG